MRYEVHTVADDDLPKGLDRVIVERVGEPTLLIISGEPARCWRFMRDWERDREAEARPTVLLRAV